MTFAAGGLALAYGLAHTAYVPVLVTDRRQLTAANSSIALTDSVIHQRPFVPAKPSARRRKL